MINLSSVSTTVNTILNDLFGNFENENYTYLKFIGQDEDNNKVFIKTLTQGFYYKKRKNPRPGEVPEKIKISSFEGDYEILDRTIELEIGHSNGFLRLGVPSKEKPKPPTMQWHLYVKKNEGSVAEIEDEV